MIPACVDTSAIGQPPNVPSFPADNSRSGNNEPTSAETVGDRRPADMNFKFDNEITAPRQARVALQSLLDDPDDPIGWRVTLAASELVTNVITHTAQGGEMRAWEPKPKVPLRLEVHDNEAALPTPPQQPARGGRGLRIVDAVADGWGVTPTPTGKYVWAEFYRPAS